MGNVAFGKLKLPKEVLKELDKTIYDGINQGRCESMLLAAGVHGLNKNSPGAKLGIILPIGFFFDRRHSKQREKLLKTFDIEIEICPEGLFIPYTMVQTGTLFLTVPNKKANGKVVIWNFEDYEQPDKRITIEPDNNHKFSFWKTDYYTACPDVNSMQLSEMVVINKGSHSSKEAIKNSGPYPFYSTNIVAISSGFNDFKGPALIVNGGGKPGIRLVEDSKFSVSQHVYILTSQDETKYPLKYIYHYLLHHLKDWAFMYRGATIQHLSQQDLNRIVVRKPLDIKVFNQQVASFEASILQLETEKVQVRSSFYEAL